MKKTNFFKLPAVNSPIVTEALKKLGVRLLMDGFLMRYNYMIGAGFLAPILKGQQVIANAENGTFFVLAPDGVSRRRLSKKVLASEIDRFFTELIMAFAIPIFEQTLPMLNLKSEDVDLFSKIERWEVQETLRCLSWRLDPNRKRHGLVVSVDTSRKEK